MKLKAFFIAALLACGIFAAPAQAEECRWPNCDKTIHTFASFLNDTTDGSPGGYWCPASAGSSTNNTANLGNDHRFKCFVPTGWEIRFISLGFAASDTLEDDEEECRISIAYADDITVDYAGPGVTADNIVNLPDGTTDAWLPILPLSNDTSKVDGYSVSMNLDRNEVVDTFWNLHIQANPGGTCLRMKSIYLVGTYEMRRK